MIIAGGPLTFSNPAPLGALVDAVLVGEADRRVVDATLAIEAATTRAGQLDALAKMAHVFVPALHVILPPVGAEHDAVLPAFSAIRTPHTELANMFLIETERGCSRACTYCVMRRSTNGGMRLASMEKILSLVPEDARRVGLVGAAVSDHPKIAEMVDTLAASGREVGRWDMGAVPLADVRRAMAHLPIEGSNPALVPRLTAWLAARG